uniref:Putative MxaS-like protein n=1 Tax=Burkholderia sp. (strain CCGE1003) TaxID=640512 RepID=E1TEX8_BURSG
MNAVAEFHYRLPMRSAGVRPGSHRGASFGSGQEFAMHGRLFDYPDPRRLDLRASVRAARSEWLVRVHLQRAAVPVQVLVDVSASMRFGTHQTKLEVAADFVEALGYSAYRVGDPLGMLAFDERARDDLFMPPRSGRGIGNLLATMLRENARSSVNAVSSSGAGSGEALRRVASSIAGRQALVFLVSDFHWPLTALPAVLDLLVHAYVVPIVVWDAAEIAPPASGPLLAVSDAESGRQRSLWLSRSVRERWREGVARRRAELSATFGKRAIQPFFIESAFDPEAMSRYFLEAVA